MLGSVVNRCAARGSNASGERLRPSVRVAGADGVDDRESRGPEVVQRILLGENVEARRRFVSRAMQLASQVPGPVLRRDAGLREPLFHAVGGHELAGVAELMSGRLEHAGGEEDSVGLRGTNTGVSVARFPLDRLPFAPSPCGDDNLAPPMTDPID